MEDNTAVHSDSAQPVPIKRPFWFGKKLLVIFTILIVFLAVSVLAVLFYKAQSKIPSELLADNITFTEQGTKAKYAEFLQAAFGTNNQQEKETYLIKSFLTLSADYNSGPAQAKRELLARLSDYLHKNFPEGAQKARISVPCRETSCGAKFEYSEDLQRIKNKISALNIAESSKKTLLNNLGNSALASGAGDNKKEFNSLNSLFFALQSLWNVGHDEGISEIARDVVNLMGKIDSQALTINKKYIDYELK